MTPRVPPQSQRATLIVKSCVAAAVGGLMYTAAMSAQEAKPPTYTAEQAQRGELVVSESCVECHGELLQGTEGPALKGDSFMKWLTARDIGAVFLKLRNTMPVDAEDSVSDTDKLDALAYLLQVNGVPEGNDELPADVEAMSKMRVQPKATAGSQPGASVETTGCLEKTPSGEWLLATSGPPSRTWRLLNVFPAPTAHVSHTVKVTGLLVKDATGDALNTTSLTMVSETCAK
jgi:mono/diheme cytochrome c family protein